MGHEILGEAATVGEALETVERLRPDAMLVDIGLPDGDGIELAGRLALLPWHPRVLLISTDADGADDATVRRLGIAGFVPKSDLPARSPSACRKEPCERGPAAARRDRRGRADARRLVAEAGCEVVAQAGDAEDLVRKTLAHKPDVAVVDVQMPPHNAADGLEAARTIRERQQGTGVLVLSQFYEESFAVALLGERAEGLGYLLKERVGDVEAFVNALRRVASGGSALDPEVVRRMVACRDSTGPIASLTRHTVSSHLRHAFAKLRINSRVELARLLHEHDVPVVA